MRRLFTTGQALERGLTRSALAWGEQNGRWRRIERGVYGDGPRPPTPLDDARAAVMATGGVACGRVAATLLQFDSIAVAGPELIVPPGANGRRRGAPRMAIAPERVVVAHGVACTDGLQTLFDLAPLVTDAVWEQALESCLRKGLTTVNAIEAELVEATPSRRPGMPRIRRVLARRPAGAPPTESLLETLMVQLAREIPNLPDPTRQFDIEDKYERFVARVDLCWPVLGLFIELDGEHHRGQPVYDASRETAVVATTGWLVGRFTWTEVRWFPVSTRRRLAALVAQGRRRPLGG